MATLDVHKILNLLPHRYPMLLVDRVVECHPGASILAVKNVTINEPFFQGHFPHRPIMPGVMILEAMAQATGVLAFYTMGVQPDSNAVYYLVGIDKARFKQPVEPGDQLILSAVLNRELKGIYRFDATAKVNDRIVASAEIMTTKADIDT